MDPIIEKAKKWVEAGRDPRSAHWQAGLESIMNVFAPYLEAGSLTPVQPLEETDLPIFREALAVVDLSPGLTAAFLPPPVADKIFPPESAAELQRIDPAKPSWKIIVLRPGREQRVLCAEISPHAGKPGVDLFQSGALLGTYDFDDQQQCLAELNKIVRAHIWEKDKWSPEGHKRYTVNWFERVMDLPGNDVCVEADFSFFHSPTLIKSNRIDAIFLLIFEVFRKRASHPGGPLETRIASIREIPDADERANKFNELAEKTVTRLLAVMKENDLVDFESFTAKEDRQYEQEFDRTVRKMVKEMAPARQGGRK